MSILDTPVRRLTKEPVRIAVVAAMRCHGGGAQLRLPTGYSSDWT